jgi:transcriptional regulator with XRE-family HTH domain
MKTNLKQIRKNAGWSNADDFAAHIGMPAKTYRNYEQGIRKIGLDVASDLCNALGCTLEELVDEKYDYAVIEIPQKGTLEPDELKLVSDYRMMDDEHRKLIVDMADAFAAMNNPNAEWTGEDGTTRTMAEIKGLR